MAAVLACGAAAVVSHRSAATLQELRASNQTRIDVTVPGRSTRKHRGIDVHRSTTLTPADVTRVNGIPCTTVARTLFDLADVLNRRHLERAFDQAEVMGVLNLLALEDVLARNRTRPAARRVRAVLADHYIGHTATWSELEETFLKLIRDAGLPDPEVNAWIDPRDGEPPIRADFVWRPQRLVVETDGHKYHRTRQAFEHDRRRDQRLVAAGWRLLRITWRQATHESDRLQETLAGLMNL
jgi:hypothetical protein